MTDLDLRSGIFLAPFHALDENPTLAREHDLEPVQHLDRRGYHEAWIEEHHSGGIKRWGRHTRLRGPVRCSF